MVALEGEGGYIPKGAVGMGMVAKMGVAVLYFLNTSTGVVA